MNELDQENDARKKGQEWIGQFDTVRKAIKDACQDLGIDDQVVIWAIHTYAKRNNIAHGDLERLKSIGDFRTLARTLHADLRDLPKRSAEPVFCVFVAGGTYRFTKGQPLPTSYASRFEQPVYQPVLPHHSKPMTLVVVPRTTFPEPHQNSPTLESQTHTYNMP